MATLTQEEYIKKQSEIHKPRVEAEIAASGAIYDTQAQNVTNSVNKQIDDTKQSYDDAFKSNETQRFINSRAIERRMAEMGLTDSGLNRTQQTAVQLSYANQKGKLERQQQSAIDTLAAAMNAELATISANKAASEQQIRSTWDDRAYTEGTNLYNAEQQRISDENIAQINAQKEIDLANIQAQEKAANKTFYEFIGAVKGDDGKDYMEYDYGSGKRRVLLGTNPYTRKNNLNSASVKEYSDVKGGVFDNGYQPRGIVDSDGTKYGLVDAVGKTELTGKKQNIWMTTGDGVKRYWVWIGEDNAYQEVKYDNSGKLVTTNHIVYI